MRRIALVAMCMALLALFIPATTLAATSSSTCAAYNPQVTCDPDKSNQLSPSTLPFTGVDVLLLAVGGGALLGTGLVVRKFSRHLD